MLPFKNRLVKRRDFEKVQKNGSFFSEGNIALKFASNEGNDARIGVVVGIKFSKLSVERNLIKRRLREIFKKYLKGKRIKKGVDIVIMARRRDNEKVKFSKFEEDTEKVLKKSSLID